MERIQVKDWAEFRTWVDADLQILPVYRRGQRDPHWPLASSFERTMLRLNGGWKPGASNIYPYDGRHFRNGKKIWGDTFYAESRDRYLGLEGDGLRVVRPTVDELGRMQGQQGLFTWLDSEKYFELQGFCDNTGRGSLLTQFVLPGSAVLEGLRDLRAHGINARVLFPDLNGAAEHANTLWDIV